MNRIALYIMGVLILTSCSRNLSRFGTDSEKFTINSVDYDYLTLKSKIKYEDGDDKQRITANIRIRRDSVIWFSLTPGLGIEAIRGVITSDSLLVIDKIKKTYTAKATGDYDEKLNFKFDLELLESLLVGNLIWPIKAEDEIKRSRGYYTISQNNPPMSMISEVGSSSMKLEKMSISSDTSVHAMEIAYSMFQKFSDMDIPTKIDMNINYISPGDYTEKMSNITVEHTKVEVDKKQKFSFIIPKRYSRR